jgi:DNA-binding NtrC family response regulator
MGKKLLLVEDDSDWRSLAGGALKDAGYEVMSVAGAAEALLLKDEPGIALVILDLDLGGENGMMLMQHLKRQHPSARILLHTGIEHDGETIQRLLKEGAHRYVRKSLLSDLTAAVQQELGES